jgi:ribosomal protein S18 acetylase RimI-like enzyme
MKIEEMTAADYDEAIALWRKTEGIGLSDADSREGLEPYLKRNPGLSFVARDDADDLVGTALCGHDGRRGYLHHVAVAESRRGQGLGSKLVDLCLERLQALGIRKCHLFVFADNHPARDFWKRRGWTKPEHVVIMSKALETAQAGKGCPC